MNSAGDDHPYRQVFESITDGIVLTGLDSGQVVAANPAAAAIHGYDRAELIGRLHAELLYPTSRSQFAAWIAATRAGRPVAASVLHIRRDGTPFAMEVRGSPGRWEGTACLLTVMREADEPEATIRRAAAQAALEERQRLAQNLHDAVNQSLFSASLIAEVLPRLWQHHPEEVLESLKDLRRLTRGALAEMRGLLVNLQPLELIESELGELLPLLADAFAGRTNIPVRLIVSDIEPLPEDAQVAFYRMCQEALNNIARHAAATTVAIELGAVDGVVELSIRDDGRGFDPQQTPSGHYGLTMMRERAAAIGASVSIASHPDEGTAITIRWPDTAAEATE